ncbi:MAG: LytTR family DNA-binding domain-containing protein [Bacillota bacterium]|nr:LytTR family DNA-binding domain-containing protein [Bacillota bacterium]
MLAILVDDENIALDALEEVLESISSIDVIEKYTSPTRFLEEVAIKKPDLVFLDIQMPIINGFDVAEEIIQMNIDTMIVFVTAYDEYAIKAFEINAIDYILKPISQERLESTVNRIIKNNKKRINNTKTIQEINYTNLKKNIKKVTVWKNERIFLISPTEISYCFAQDGEINIITKENDVYKSKYSLSFWEKKLEHYKFLRCHRSFLVNIEKIDEIIPDVNSTYLLKIKNLKEQIPVSRSYLKVFKNLLDL